MRKIFVYLKKVIAYNLHFASILLHFSQQMFFWEHLDIYHHLKVTQIKTLCIYKNKNEIFLFYFPVKNYENHSNLRVKKRGIYGMSGLYI